MYYRKAIVTCLEGSTPVLRGVFLEAGATEMRPLKLARIVHDTIQLYQTIFLFQSLTPIADNRSGALTRAERLTGLAPRVASEQSGKLHTVAPKGQRLRGEPKGQQTQSIISGSKLARCEGQTCRSLKTRADNDSVCIAGSPEDYYIDRSCGRANYTLFVSTYAKEKRI